jgi:hypothetical protein
MGDILLSDGKMIAVIVVAAIILLGLAVFLVTMDRRISKLEKQSK